MESTTAGPPEGPIGSAGTPGTTGAVIVQLQDQLKGRWKWLLWIGIAIAVVGFVAILVPAFASVTTTLFFGWLLVFGGFLQLIDAFSVHSGWRIAGRLVLAVLSVVAGFWLIAKPISGTELLTVVLCAWFIATGILRLIAWVRERGAPGAGFVGINGLLSLILGVLIAFSLPESSSWAIGLLVGIDFLFAGFALIAAAMAAKRLAQGT